MNQRSKTRLNSDLERLRSITTMNVKKLIGTWTRKLNVNGSGILTNDPNFYAQIMQWLVGGYKLGFRRLVGGNI